MKIEQRPAELPSGALQTERDEAKNRELLEMVARANREAERIVSDASERANEILLQAQREYDAILSQAHSMADEILKKAHLQAQGYLEKLSASLISLMQGFEESLQSMLQVYSEKILTTLRILVEKFLEKEVDEEVTLRKLNRVLTHLVSATKVKLRINPNDMQLLPESTLAIIRSRGYELVADPSVSHGVIAETELGTIDTTLGFQMTLLDELFEEIEGRED